MSVFTKRMVKPYGITLFATLTINALRCFMMKLAHVKFQFNPIFNHIIRLFSAVKGITGKSMAV